MRRVALVVLAAALVAGVALTAAGSLAGGWERAAERADLPDLIIRFDPEARATVDAKLGALPNVEARAYRREENRVPVFAGGRASDRGALHLVGEGRRGYAIVAGRDLRAPGEALVERGVAEEWDLAPGDEVTLYGDVRLELVGVALSPDNVAFPLAKVPRFYVSEREVPASSRPVEVDVALVWLADPAREDVTLTQARAVAFGLDDLRVVTRTGVRVLIGQAAGIVVALLIAFALVALGAAGIVLAAAARSEVARRTSVIGLERALGFSRPQIVAGHARRAALAAAPAAVAGLALGWLAVHEPVDRLLHTLNEDGPGRALGWWMGAAWGAIVALVALAAAWPAWRATAGPPAALLRGGELATGRAGRRGSRRGRGGGPVVLGARLAVARPARWAVVVGGLGAVLGVVVLLLALSSLLVALRDDPGTLGKRYELLAALDADRAEDVRAIAGVEDAAPRWTLRATAASSLGQPLRLVALPRGAEDLEAPPLAEGRRRTGPAEAEVGVGLADALGLRPGGTLAVALPGGAEARFRVTGLVRALDEDGRLAYVDAEPLAALGVLDPGEIAVALEPGADRGAVTRRLAALGALAREATTATSGDRDFLAVLASVLRIVALTVALVCLVVLAQTLVLTARERRGTLALLRTLGGGSATLAAVLGGACAALLVPALVLGVALEALVLGPAVAGLAAGYAGLSLGPAPGQVALAAGLVAALGLLAVAWVARRVVREPVVAGLRREPG